MSDDGKMRSLLLPEDLNSFPEKISGTCRMAKFSPNEHTPYNSIIKLENTTLGDITNNILSQSYQLRSQIYLSEKSDQSLMISKLPEININKVEVHYPLSVEQYYLKIREQVEGLFLNAEADYIAIQERFEKAGLFLLSTKEVLFHCNCSKEKMYSGLYNLIKTTGIDKVFMPDETEIETKCDYCKTVFIFQKNDFSI
jgi:molecular chaperone Hsp33